MYKFRDSPLVPISLVLLPDLVKAITPRIRNFLRAGERGEGGEIVGRKWAAVTRSNLSTSGLQCCITVCHSSCFFIYLAIDSALLTDFLMIPNFSIYSPNLPDIEGHIARRSARHSASTEPCSRARLRHYACFFPERSPRDDPFEGSRFRSLT